MKRSEIFVRQQRLVSCWHGQLRPQQ